MYQIFVYVPESHKEEVKTAILETKAGTYNYYENCCWETQGMGQELW